MDEVRAERHLLQVRPGTKRNELEQERDLFWIVGEVAKGRSYKDISDEINCNREYTLTPEAVRLSVNKALIEWKRQNMENIDAVIGKELARLERIERIVDEDYRKSRGLRAMDYAALMKRGMTIDEIDDIFRDRVPGDPRYLEVLLHVQMQKLKLLGLDKGNDVPQNTIVNYNFGSMSDEALAKMADSLQDAHSKTILTEGQTVDTQ